MASYQTRQRDPLLDQSMQAMLERRGKELLGLALVALGVAVAAMLATYTPEDPGWMVATDQPAQNALGRFGAAAASTLIVIIGLGAWGIAPVFLIWGLRFLLHRGEDRAAHRIVFAVLAVALGAIFAASHVPGPGWPHAFGLGGLFGDTVLGATLEVLPIGAGLGLRLLSVATGLGTLALYLFVTGFAPDELRAIGRFLMVGLIVAFATLVALAGRMVRLTGQGAGGAARAAIDLRARGRARARAAADRRAAALALAEPPAIDPADTGAAPAPGLWQRRPGAVAAARPGAGAALAPEPLRAAPPAPGLTDRLHALGAHSDGLPPPPVRALGPAGQPRAVPAAAAAPAAAPAGLGGLLARVPGLIKRTTEPEPEPEWVDLSPPIPGEAPSEDRIRARISDAIRARARPASAPAQPAAAPVRPEPPVIRPRGPAPLIADTRRPPAARPEPPVAAPTAAPTATLTAAPVAPAVPPSVPASVPDGLPPAPPRPLAAETRRLVQQPAPRAASPSRQALAEAQPSLRFDETGEGYELPPLSLLACPRPGAVPAQSQEALAENARMLETVLDDYGIKGEIVRVNAGPVVTLYELEPAPGLKASRVIGLADDIARSMSALSARVSTVPGRTVIGIELPNAHRQKVLLREILASRDFGDSTQRLPLALGKDISGQPVVASLAKMPHLLIAGTTGSGKSVAINTMILSLLYKLSPEDCRLIMIDPKMLELSVYDGIPHLLSPVVTDPKKAVVALKWVVGEMEERYRKMSRMGVRNIEGYNGRVREALERGEMFRRTVQTGFDEETGDPVFETEEFEPRALPFIVVVVDEMADLMMVAGKEIEACIQRLAQMARASGIHLIMATQRPSVDVITGTIKANFPTRISFQVTSKIDSRTILGEQGAEQLLGMGDMLYMAGGARITRIHGPFVSDEEVEEIVNHLKSFGPPSYVSGVVEGVDEDRESGIDAVLGLNAGDNADDALYDQAVAIVAKDRKCSTSYIQRKLGIGYNKAARLVEQMEEQGVVSPANHVGKREVLVPEP